MFIAGIGLSYQDVDNAGHASVSSWLRNVKFHMLMVFVPAATVYTTQGINHFIVRRCHREIVVFSVFTLFISTGVSALYAYTFLDTTEINYSLLFGILLCSNERLPIADALFEEGRYPILTTMLQAESILNNLFVWSVLDIVETRVRMNALLRAQLRRTPYAPPKGDCLAAFEISFLGHGRAMVITKS
ncbi:hypothetical protein HPB48_004330 [Haemaphysalis longicornis]|uniref:Cation/H+ exchanger domain-containing protein n=1 Tax=Haemaphysalis longicornis TaxID=44386 RepID=A0A9J6G1I1_HAELO|nr:hypothetical protein HPB48_004330 [Haemaphysalis longicornis]